MKQNHDRIGHTKKKKTNNREQRIRGDREKKKAQKWRKKMVLGIRMA